MNDESVGFLKYGDDDIKDKIIELVAEGKLDNSEIVEFMVKYIRSKGENE